jgi:hypothetical protein
VLAGVLIYNVLAALLLAFAGAGLTMAGVALWPAVLYHAVLAAWCVACWPRRETEVHRPPRLGLLPECLVVRLELNLDRT